MSVSPHPLLKGREGGLKRKKSVGEACERSKVTAPSLLAFFEQLSVYTGKSSSQLGGATLLHDTDRLGKCEEKNDAVNPT